MALTPAQMGDAIVRNLETKTGHSLDYWLNVLREGQATDRKSAIIHLKAAGLGHFQAQKVWEVSRGEDPYADPEALVAAQFPGPAREAYEAFAGACAALGDDVEARPCRTYVPFYAGRQFAMMTAKPDGSLHVGLALPAGFTDEAVVSARGLGGSARINAAFELAADGSLTAAQRQVLAEAYAYNRCDARCTRELRSFDPR